MRKPLGLFELDQQRYVFCHFFGHFVHSCFVCDVVAEAVGGRDNLEELEGFPEAAADVVEAAGDVINIDDDIEEELTPKLMVMKVTTLEKIYIISTTILPILIYFLFITSNCNYL